MISLERSKQLLNDPMLSNDEVEQIRDELYALGDIIYEIWYDEKIRSKQVNKAR